MDMTQVRENFETITSTDEAVREVILLPVQTLYEAKWALQELKNSDQITPELKSQVIEPLARAVGWAEALAYATSCSPFVQPSFQNGRQNH